MSRDLTETEIRSSFEFRASPKKHRVCKGLSTESSKEFGFCVSAHTSTGGVTIHDSEALLAIRAGLHNSASSSSSGSDHNILPPFPEPHQSSRSRQQTAGNSLEPRPADIVLTPFLSKHFDRYSHSGRPPPAKSFSYNDILLTRVFSLGSHRRTGGEKTRRKVENSDLRGLPVVRKPGRRLNGPGSFDRNRETPHYFHVEIASTSGASRRSRAVNRRRCQRLVDSTLVDLRQTVVERSHAVLALLSRSPGVVDAFSSVGRCIVSRDKLSIGIFSRAIVPGRMLIYNLYICTIRRTELFSLLTTRRNVFCFRFNIELGSPADCETCRLF